MICEWVVIFFFFGEDSCPTHPSKPALIQMECLMEKLVTWKAKGCIKPCNMTKENKTKQKPRLVKSHIAAAHFHVYIYR